MTAPPSSPTPLPGAVVVDANVAVAITSREAGRDVKATAELNAYAAQGYEWFAPGALLTETLYALCQKYQSGLLTASEHTAAVNTLEVMMNSLLPPPGGEVSLVQRAYKIGETYGCSRSADAVYIALAEELTKTRPTVLLTFDQGIPNQAARNAPTVTVQIITI